MPDPRPSNGMTTYAPMTALDRQPNAETSSQQMPWKTDRENAPLSGHVQHRQASAVGFDGPTRDGKAEAQATPVRAALCERLEHRPGESRGKAAAVVLDVNQDAVSGAVSVQRDFATGMSEFERVLKEVVQRR